MARSIFGGLLVEVGVAVGTDLTLKLGPNAQLPDLYDAPLGVARSIVTDFKLDLDNSGAFATAVSSITTDAAGIPPYFQGPDGLTSLYDLAGHRLKANDVDASGAPAATTTLAGIVELATTAETTTGTDTTRATVPSGVKAVMDAHLAAADPHQVYSDALTELTGQLNLKADVVGPPGLETVPLDRLPASTGEAPDTLVLREPVTAAAQVGPASADNHAMQRIQTLAAIASGAGTLADWRQMPVAGAPLSSTNTTFQTLTGAAITDGASGQKWACGVYLPCKGLPAAGIQIRQKLGATAVTNLIANPSFETNTTGWSVSSNATIARATTGGAQDGTAYLKVTCVTAGTILVNSAFTPTVFNDPRSSAAYVRVASGSVARTVRADINWQDGVNLLSGGNGPNTATAVGSWTRAINNGAGTAPTGTVNSRLRVAIVSAAVGEEFHIDATQLEPTATVPAFGSTGGSGSTAFSIEGGWGPNLILASPTVNDYRNRTPIFYPTETNLTHQAGLLGTGAGQTTDLVGYFEILIGGAGLTSQRLEFEWAQQSTNATATQILGGSATFVRIQ